MALRITFLSVLFNDNVSLFTINSLQLQIQIQIQIQIVSIVKYGLITKIQRIVIKNIIIPHH